MIVLIEWLVPDHGHVTRSLVTLVGGCFILGGLYGWLIGGDDGRVGKPVGPGSQP